MFLLFLHKNSNPRIEPSTLFFFRSKSFIAAIKQKRYKANVVEILLPSLLKADLWRKLVGMVSVFLKILFVKLTFSTTTTTTTNLKIENSICISSKMLINSMVHKIYWQLTTLQYYSITPSYCCLLLLFKLQCKYLDQAMLCWLWSNYYYYPEKSLIYSFPFDPELRATNFSVKMMFSEAFQCSYLELKNSGPPGKRPPDPYTKNRSATQNDREKKQKQTKPHQCGPPCPAVLVDMRPLPNG